MGNLKLLPKSSISKCQNLSEPVGNLSEPVGNISKLSFRDSRVPRVRVAGAIVSRTREGGLPLGHTVRGSAVASGGRETTEMGETCRKPVGNRSKPVGNLSETGQNLSETGRNWFFGILRRRGAAPRVRWGCRHTRRSLPPWFCVRGSAVALSGR